MKKFDIMGSIRREMNLKNVSLELLEKVIEVVFERDEFQYSFKENPLRKFSSKELLEELMRR